MANRHSRAFLLLILGASLAAILPAADTPPSPLHRVGDHWTAWNSPATPEGASVYIIESGDTFWALASRHLGNPYLWPQLWERNQYVLDAHWIYPGDPLLLDVQVAPAGTLGAVGGGTAPGEGSAPGGESTSAAGAGETMASDLGTSEVEPGGAGGAAGEAGGGEGESAADRSTASGMAAGGASRAGSGTGAASGTAAGTASGTPPIPGVAPAGGRGAAPVPLGTQDDIYCSGFIGDPAEPFGYSIIGSEYEVLSPQMENPVYGRVEGVLGTVDSVKYRLTTGDIVYLDGGRAGGLSPGELLTAIEPGNVVKHPVSREVIGRQYNYIGRVRVLSVQETSAIAEIVQSCGGVVVGMKLKPFEPEPIPLARRTPERPVNEPTSAEALAEAPVIVSSPISLVTLGQDHVVFIDRGEDDDVFPGDVFTIYRVNRPALPPVVLGELAVLSTQRHTAVAKIIESRYPVYVGDRLERK